jgi:hypothetical protein
MRSREETTELRAKMIEHLESVIALADETRDFTTSYLLERALDH